MEFEDVLNGLVKAEIFGFVVVLVCCNIGLNTRGGPREIGASVTRAVVISLILILVLDYFVTQIPHLTMPERLNHTRNPFTQAGNPRRRRQHRAPDEKLRQLTRC